MPTQPDTKNYNKPLRSSILICSIRVEEAASDAVRNLLRTVKGDSKTLSNKSSSLSLKNKIDLLYDIDDLNKDDYTFALKFMEIRNQFIHNPKCNTFLDLKEESPDLIKFLRKNIPNEIDNENSSLIESFKELFTRVLGKLLVLKIEYRKGSSSEMHRYVNSKTLENFDEIFNSAFKSWKDEKELNSYKSEYATPPHMLFADTSAETIESFEHYLKIKIIDNQIKLLDAITNDEIDKKEIFQRREDLLLELKKEQQKEKKCRVGKGDFHP